MITVMLKLDGIITEGKVSEWENMPDEDLFDHLLRLTIPSGSNTSDTQEVRIADRYAAIRLNIDFQNNINRGLQKLCTDMIQPLRTERLIADGCLDTESTLPEKFRKELFKTVIGNFKKGGPPDNVVYYTNIAAKVQMDAGFARCRTITDFIGICTTYVMQVATIYQFNAANRMGRSNEGYSGGKQQDHQERSNKKRSHEDISSRPSTHTPCDGCGKRHEGGRERCNTTLTLILTQPEIGLNRPLESF